MPKNKKEEIVLQDITLTSPELSCEMDSNSKPETVYSWKEAAIKIVLSEKKFEYVKTSLFSGLMILVNMLVSTRLIFIEAMKDSVEWRQFKFFGVEAELPSAVYIFVIANILNFIIIFGAKLIEKHFNKKEMENGL